MTFSFENCSFEYSQKLHDLTRHDYFLLQKTAYRMRTNGSFLSSKYSPKELIESDEIEENKQLSEDQKQKEVVYKNLVNHDFLNDENIRVDGGIKCRFCKHNEMDVEIKQTRSADEGSTTFLTCRRCGKRCKM